MTKSYKTFLVAVLTFLFAHVAHAQFNYQFRVIVSNSVGSVTSDAATFSFSSSIPAMPLWALTALVALIFLMAMPSLTKRHCAT